MEFSAVVLSEIGDYLLEDEDQYEWTEKGLELTEAYVINEDGVAQRVRAETLLITHNALQGIQEGSFEEEVK